MPWQKEDCYSGKVETMGLSPTVKTPTTSEQLGRRWKPFLIKCEGGSSIYFMILALSFLVPDAVMAIAIEVPYIETVERITNVDYIIVEHLARVNEPQDFGFWLRFKTSVSWPNWDILEVMQNRRRMYRMEKAHRLVQAE